MSINSISHKIVLTIVIPVIGVLMVLGIINYFDTKSILLQLNSTEQLFVREEIKSFIELQFVALDIIEDPIQLQMETYSNKIVNNFYTEKIDPELSDLGKIREELGMDASVYDLYVINTNGIVVNTTYKDDLGINFFDFGEMHKQYLEHIFRDGIFDSPKFFFEGKTKRYKKYSYQPTKDKNYIIEIGLYSKQADRVFDYMISHLDKIATQRKSLNSVDLFFLTDKPIALKTKTEFIPEHLTMLKELEDSLILTVKPSKSKKSDGSYTYIYVENVNSKLIKGAIVRLSTNSNFQLSFEKKEMLKFVFVLLVALLLVVVIAILINPIGKSINKITKVAKELAIGNISVKIDADLKDRKDELGDLSTAIDTLVAHLVQTSEFAIQTGKGNFNETYNLLSEKDTLGKTLMEMQARLTQSKNEEDRAVEEEKKNKFITDGLGLFAEILRSNNNNITLLCEQIMSNLVNYLNIPMGALFVAEKENDVLTFNAKAAIAYDRLRLFEKKIKITEGLVGRCAFERLPIYLEEIPQDYLHITTGLGTSNPGNIVLIPLIVEDEIFGVIELASFEKMEAHKISFAEQLAKGIASTLKSVQINNQTVELLEQSKKQQEELSIKEEEMRQNMEELQATQEESSNRENNLSTILKAFEGSVFKIEYDFNGIILDVNEKYLTFLEANANSILGNQYGYEYKLLGLDALKLDENWMKLQRGMPQEIYHEVRLNTKKGNLHEYLWPVSDRNGIKISKIIKVSYFS